MDRADNKQIEWLRLKTTYIAVHVFFICTPQVESLRHTGNGVQT